MTTDQKRGALAREREKQALKYLLQGWTETKIAEKLKISQPAVSKILARIRARTLEDVDALQEQIRADHTLMLANQYAEAMAGWAKTKDAKFLTEARSTLADLRKLWGVDAPESIDVLFSRMSNADLIAQATGLLGRIDPALLGREAAGVPDGRE
jgi:predicted transcriptional regulator